MLRRKRSRRRLVEIGRPNVDGQAFLRTLTCQGVRLKHRSKERAAAPEAAVSPDSGWLHGDLKDAGVRTAQLR